MLEWLSKKTKTVVLVPEALVMEFGVPNGNEEHLCLPKEMATDL